MDEKFIAILFDVEVLRESPFVELLKKLELLLKKVIRRSIDILIAIIGIIVIVPITTLVLLGKLINKDFSKIFTSECRIGKNGKKFKMYKFNFAKDNEQAKFFEKTSIDELPQFINILIGEMTLVGPRPYKPEEKEKMGIYFNYISQLKPGLTGVYQISGKTQMSFYDRLDMDILYFYNRKFWTDIKILLITLLITTKRKEVGKFADYTYTTLKEAMTIILKRMIDILGALVGIVILIPLTLIITIVKFIFGDRGPVFYNQERIGRYGKHFKMYKFRSMVVDADEKLEELLKMDSKARMEFNEYKKIKDDPRITKIGKILRKTSLDEFPQFINVLKGEMSLVGPRAYSVTEKKDMGEAYETIIKCKPGLTGLWQVSGRSNLSFRSRLALDVEYYTKYNLRLDVEILLKTVSVVISCNGAE